MNNKIIKCIFIIMIFFIAINTPNIIATKGKIVESNIRPSDPGSGTIEEEIKERTDDMWATISFVVQVLAVGTVVFAGLRYMFASSEQKADIKQGLIYIVIGAILVFCAVAVIQLVSGAAKDIIKNTPATVGPPTVKPPTVPDELVTQEES